MKHLAFLSLVLVVLTSIAPASAQDKVEETPYYPLKVGTTWTYKPVEPPSATKMVFKVVKHEMVGAVLCARIESLVDGKTAAYEHVTATKDGIYRHSLNGLKPDPPVLLLKLPAKKGDTWKVETKLGNEKVNGEMTTREAMLTVPAGKYQALVVQAKLKTGDKPMLSEMSFVKDVGIARIKMEIEGQIIVLELEKFEPGK